MKKENKISKICWNTSNWKFPSGSEGKSPTSSSYESQYGYGHEEWLLDKSRIINGWHCAFLQTLNLKTDRHVGKTFNIHLFSTFKSTYYYVGKINNALCVSKDESKDIYKTYKKNGWLKEMAIELSNAGVDLYEFKNTPPEIFFNMKFKFEDFIPPASGDLEEISDSDTNITTNRYKLLRFNSNIIFAEELLENEGNKKQTKKRKRTINGSATINPIHDKIQNALFELLTTKYAKLYKKVDIEKDRVDVKALTHDDHWHYFEIKTDDPKLSIRKGLGQLLEYSYFPKKQSADKLIIVSDSLPNNDTKNYLKHLRKLFSLNLYYRAFDLENNTISVDY